jgi:hypothetical protein
LGVEGKMSNKLQDRAHINDLFVYKQANIECNTYLKKDLHTKGNTYIKGNLEVSGCIIGQRDEIPMTPAAERHAEAYARRVQAARENYRIAPPETHMNNGDEDVYPNKIANFHKGLRHNAVTGEVNLEDYQKLKDAVDNPLLWDFVPIAGVRKLENPLGGVAYSLQGADSHALALAPAPLLDSAEQASEMIENYWMALMRDVRFDQYSSDPLAAKAIADLNAVSVFTGPKDGGVVTAGTLFRGPAPGCLLGPYLSQFFYLDCNFGASYISQKMRVPVAGDDFITDWSEFVNIQNGGAPGGSQTFETERRYMINGRDLGEFVHIDVLYQAYLHAGLIMYNLGCPKNPGNPYVTGHQNQTDFITFGDPYIATLLAEVCTRALRAVWHKKWFVHRRLRPEAFGGLIDRQMNGHDLGLTIHADLAGSQALAEVFAKNGNYLLPQAFPEGSPMHPSYGAGHATVAGACTTILKAIFDAENWVIPSPVQPDATGENLVAYTGGDILTGAGELNKIAYNVTLGRDHAGVHWRTDASLELGEAVAISVLRDHRKIHHPAEHLGGYTFTKFDGTEITV